MCNENKQEMDRVELKAYPSIDGLFIGSININSNEVGLKSQPQNEPDTVIIVDRSGSMGNYVSKIVNQVLPVLFNRLSYDPKSFIHLITFDSEVEYFRIKIKDLENHKINCRGRTYMAGTVHKLKDILFNSNGSRRSFRLLTVSDGAIHDPIDVKNAGAELARMVSQDTLRINSQAVRLFTSHCQPDTTALCSLLQLNNMTRNQLIDIQAQTEIDVMTNQIADLFINDGFTNGFTLNSGLLGLPVFLNYPWEQTPQSKLHLIKGNNVFWMKEVPTTIKVNDAPVKISIDPEINLDDFHNLIGAKFDQIVGHIKVLKIVGSKEAVETSKQALEYFTKQETNLGNLESLASLGDATILSNRVKRTIELKRKNLSRVLATIINDDTVSQLNSAQRADYLREVGFTRSSRGLAKRAAKEGLDFNEIARNEVMEMAKHFCEIEDVDDSNHLVSFFAQDTTFGGIQALVDVSKNENFNLFDVDDIIELLNVVGVACSGPIGDFPDPMTWSVNEIYLGCYSSVSDVLVGYNQSKGGKLLAPAIDKEITNVIPVFDDKRIAKFLKKYAPSLLEYACSIGMRRVIADVPMTAGYTICAGVWKMISEIDENKSTLHLEVFKQILTSFDDYVGKYFDHISPFIHDQDNEKMSFHIGYNGISNMLPLLQVYKDNDEGKLKLIPNILRTIYAHEVWQTVRHAYKGKQDSDEIIKKMLCKLLGINLNDHKITLQKLFIPEPELAEILFYDKLNIDETYLNKFKKPLSYINYLALLPKYFEAAVDDFKLIKDIPKLSDSTVLETLQVDYSYDLFIFFNVFQALRYPTRASREDSEMNKMKILDLKNQQEAINDVKDFIRELLKTQYLSELSAKRKQETKTMAEIIAGKIFEATSVEAMIDVWRNGITRCGVTYKIENISSPGYKVLCQLLCSSEDSSQRSNIFRVLLLCVDNEGLPVWNNGSTNFITNAEQDSFEAAYQTVDTWDNWNALMTEYKSNFKKVYRDYAVNRHGHGNSKRSYCANGYKTMKEFRSSVPEEEFREYCETHIDCCGVRNLDPKFLKTLNVKL